MKLNRELFNKVLMYFFKGLLLAIPLALTVYILSLALHWIDGLIGLKIPGLGMLIVIASITLFGYLGSTLLVKSILDFTESFITKVPLLNIVYSSLKEFTAAFLGHKKKFSRPVLVMINKAERIQRLGFVTQEALQGIHLSDSIAVYFPHSYNFSGNLLIVPKDAITPLHIPSTDVMKFIISGGIATLQPLDEKQPS